MCIALPVEIIAIADPAVPIVTVEGGDGREDVNAALVAVPGMPAGALVGRWALIHAGFVLSLIDAEDARSRLAVFAAMRDATFGGSGNLPCPVPLRE